VAKPLHTKSGDFLKFYFKCILKCLSILLFSLYVIVLVKGGRFILLKIGRSKRSQSGKHYIFFPFSGERLVESESFFGLKLSAPKGESSSGSAFLGELADKQTHRQTHWYNIALEEGWDYWGMLNGYKCRLSTGNILIHSHQ